MSERPFALTISLNVLEHLGINLYSNVPSVLSEIVANAWDADATVVKVNWNRSNGSIVISDNGSGMTPAEVNGRFLKVGHRRRDDQPGPTPIYNRTPMGRKGIGKLSLFSIAGCIEIETVKLGQVSAFSMRLEEIRDIVRAAGGTGTYHPEEMRGDKVDFESGTRITLKDLRHRQTVATSRAVRKRVARRFSVLGPASNFQVYIDDEPVSAKDRDYYDKVQYAWTYGDSQHEFPNADNLEPRSSNGEIDDLAISGWLGTVRESRQLKDEDGENLNRIAVFVRGKMAQEDILGDFAERGVYASYLIGELSVEGLDTYDGPGTKQDEDAATSSRQRLVEDDVRYTRLRNFLSLELKHIQSRWSDLRAEAGTRRAMEIPEVKQWLESLSASTRTRARKWLGKINRIRMDDLGEQKELMKHAVLGFEFYRIHENLDALDEVSDDNLKSLLGIFRELDGLEASLYGQIVQQRIHVIKTLQEKVDENALEKAIQQYLFDHLWLLDPSWERVEGTEIMERRATSMFGDLNAKLSESERSGRLDIAYRKAAGQHIIIELKRPERTLARSELLDQAEKYLSAMLRLLEAQDTPHEPVEIVFVLGKPPKEWENPKGKERVAEQLRASNARIVFYDKLLVNAEKAYRDYLEKRGELDVLGKVIAAIEDYSHPGVTG